MDIQSIGCADIRKLIRLLGNAPDAELAWLARRIRQAEQRVKAEKETV